jgi:predicted esterase
MQWTVVIPATSPCGVSSTMIVHKEISFHCLGYLSGQQQGQLQEVDSLVHVHGMRDHLVYQRLAKALVARLSAQQSPAIKFTILEVKRGFQTMETVIE